MTKYIVKDIEEPDFGCEGLLDGENGDIISIDAADAYLYEKDINVGDSVYIDKSAENVITKC